MKKVLLTCALTLGLVGVGATFASSFNVAGIPTEHVAPKTIELAGIPTEHVVTPLGIPTEH